MSRKKLGVLLEDRVLQKSELSKKINGFQIQHF